MGSNLIQNGPCNVPLTAINGSGFNTVNVPAAQGAEYKSNTEALLYEVWQTNLLILEALGGMPVVLPITFTIGDGQVGTPAANATQLFVPAIQGQAINNKTLLVLRNGIGLQYTSGPTQGQIRRLNDGTNGGFAFEIAGWSFQNGETYSIWVIGQNTAIAA